MVTYLYTYPQKFIRDTAIAPFSLLSVVIVTLPNCTAQGRA